MNRFFLGKWWHWLLLIIFITLLWQSGQYKLHVIEFNTFVMLLLAATIVGLLVLILSTSANEQITREKLRNTDDG